MKEELCALFELTDPLAARRGWKRWFDATEASGIPTLVRFAELKRPRLDGLIAHAVFSISTGKLEGFNNKTKVAKRIGYGYRDDVAGAAPAAAVIIWAILFPSLRRGLLHPKQAPLAEARGIPGDFNSLHNYALVITAITSTSSAMPQSAACGPFCTSAKGTSITFMPRTPTATPLMSFCKSSTACAPSYSPARWSGSRDRRAPE